MHWVRPMNHWPSSARRKAAYKSYALPTPFGAVFSGATSSPNRLEWRVVLQPSSAPLFSQPGSDSMTGRPVSRINPLPPDLRLEPLMRIRSAGFVVVVSSGPAPIGRFTRDRPCLWRTYPRVGRPANRTRACDLWRVGSAIPVGSWGFDGCRQNSRPAFACPANINISAGERHLTFLQNPPHPAPR